MEMPLTPDQQREHNRRHFAALAQALADLRGALRAEGFKPDDIRPLLSAFLAAQLAPRPPDPATQQAIMDNVMDRMMRGLRGEEP